MLNYLFSNTEITTYFEHTNHELKIYSIKGAEEGATLMIIGGIQGDETAAFLAADNFLDIALKKGNLIVIPRANLHSIFLSQRQINDDMNRRFAQEKPVIYEDEVVEIIKKYIHKSNLLLNLHEGSGFYRHQWEGPMHNPMRYGQCLIADTDIFQTENKTINLKEIAETVITEINKYITNEEYLYRFNNHNTVSSDTKHPEQRKSASFYGLTKAHIPSFGVEVSKSLPSESLKKSYIKLIINQFLKYLEIEMDCPHLFDELPELNYILCKIDYTQHYFTRDDIIKIPRGSSLEITGIHSNYTRGNYVDVLGHGNRNDLNKKFRIEEQTEIHVYKDNLILAKIPVIIAVEIEQIYEGFRVKIIDDNSFVNINLGDTLFVTEAVDFEILGTINNNKDITINLLGYNNQTRRVDDKHFIINSHSSLSNRFAIDTEKSLYQFLIKQNSEVLGYNYLKIEPIIAGNLKLFVNKEMIIMAPNDTIFVAYGDTLYIEDVDLNQISSEKVKVNLAGYILDPTKDAEDRGGDIYLTNDKLIPRFAVNPERTHYEIHVLFDSKRYATYNLIINK